VLPSSLGYFPRGLLGLVVPGGWEVLRAGLANSFWSLALAFQEARESMRMGVGLRLKGVGRELTVRPKYRLVFPDNNLLIRMRPTALLISIIFVASKSSTDRQSP
jgi:hypothetical protein